MYVAHPVRCLFSNSDAKLVIMATAFALGEALALGLMSGPACVASCGPVVVPTLLAGNSGLRLHGRYLSTFLATRLCGYLLFAAMAWEFGNLAALPSVARSLVLGPIHLLLAGALLRYAYSVGCNCGRSCKSAELVTIGSAGNHRVPGAAALGFLTGVSLCPPFVAAGVRAAEAASMVTALLFFAAFFLATTVWFVPFAALGWVRRNEAVITVARMTMVLIALYYLYAGVTILIRKNTYGF